MTYRRSYLQQFTESVLFARSQLRSFSQASIPRGEFAMKSAKLLLVVGAVLLASSAWGQTLPKDTDIKVRTDTAIPAKPEANAKFGATVSNDVTDSSGSVVIPKGSRARLVAVANGNDTTLDLRSVTVNGR